MCFLSAVPGSDRSPQKLRVSCASPCPSLARGLKRVHTIVNAARKECVRQSARVVCVRNHGLNLSPHPNYDQW
jgi:hypothetical protein